MLEKAIQKSVNTWAKAKYRDDLVIRKFSVGSRYGSNGDPDSLYMKRGGQVLFVEWKAEGGACTDLQRQRHAEFRALGFNVVVCDSTYIGRRVIDEFMSGRLKGLSK